MGGIVIVYAYDPVEALGAGVLVLDAEVGGRLVAEHRAELIETHRHEPMRFVAGSAANLAARDALRAARSEAEARPARKRAKLES